MREPARPVFCLIVDDDPVVALDLADALGNQNWYVAGPFIRGREALKWLSQFTPDVAVVNPTLGDGRGGEILSWLRERNVPLVLQTRDAPCPFSPSGGPTSSIPPTQGPTLAKLMTLYEEIRMARSA
jgi:hypothetical protein